MPREVMLGEGRGPGGGEDLGPALPIPLLPWDRGRQFLGSFSLTLRTGL